MPGREKTYDAAEVMARLVDLPGWRLGDGVIERQYGTVGWTATLMVVNAIGHLSEAAWHHPELVVAYGGVLVRLSTHSARGITDKDFELARKIEAVVGWRPGLEGGALTGPPNDPRRGYVHHDG